MVEPVFVSVHSENKEFTAVCQRGKISLQHAFTFSNK
jgi:hypothetical protein